MVGLGKNTGDDGRSYIDMHINICHGGYSWPDKWPHEWGGDPIKVPLRSLSEAVGNRHVVVMKIDTEGNEMSILGSGVDVFERGQVDYLIVETKPDEWSKRHIDPAPLDKIMNLAKRVIQIESSAAHSKGSPWNSVNYLFEFVDKPVTLVSSGDHRTC